MVSAFGWLPKLLRCDQLSTASARLRTRPTKQRSHSCNSYNPRPVMNTTKTRLFNLSLIARRKLISWPSHSLTSAHGTTSRNEFRPCSTLNLSPEREMETERELYVVLFSNSFK
jgi:hypothetical protein